MKYVMVFEATHDVFGPFDSIKQVEQHLRKTGFRKVSSRYWACNDAYVYIKPLQAPRG